MKLKLTGTGVALVTPFNQMQAIDYNGLQQLLAYTQNHVEYWVVQGTTGETATTTLQEKTDLLAFVKQNNPKGLPIVYGLGGNNTEELLAYIDKTDFGGVSAILSVSPYYNKPSQAGIIRHYQLLADRSPVPVILYNVPARTGSNLTAETTLTLAQHPNIIGIKEASGNFTQCLSIAKNKPQDFMLISGDDMLTVPLIAVGACGVISVLANAYPKTFAEKVRLALAGNFTEATKILHQFLEINDLMYAEGNPTGIKYSLKLAGVADEFVRLPLVTASEGLKQKIQLWHEKIQ